MTGGMQPKPLAALLFGIGAIAIVSGILFRNDFVLGIGVGIIVIGAIVVVRVWRDSR